MIFYNKIFIHLTFLFSAVLLSFNSVGQTFQFPIKVSENGRYFEDQQGKPFFYSADTGWKLFMRLDKSEALDYLVDRKAKGFTAIQVMLTGSIAEANVEGEAPFRSSNDFSTLNHAFFEHAKSVVSIADSLDLLMVIAPLWAGCCGEGYAGRNNYMVNNGPERSKGFGMFLGEFFSSFNNIFWIIGGDNDPSKSREAMDALAQGIKSSAPHQLVMYHAASTHSSTDVWDNPSWLDISMVYTYFRGFNKAWNLKQLDVYEVGYTEFRKRPIRPFILGESTYEGEHGEWGSALQIRKQAYWAVFSGATGHAYGSPNWNFPENWKEILEYPGARSLIHLKSLLYTKSWEQLVPDIGGDFIIDGAGPYASNDYAVAAIAADKSFAFCYLPSKKKITVELKKLVSKKVTVSWFDPILGDFTKVGIYNKNNPLTLTPPTEQDWVLVLE